MQNRNLEKLQAFRERTQHFRLQQDGPSRAYFGDKLEADARRLLDDEAAGLNRAEVAFVEAVVRIAQGDDIELPALPDAVRSTHLSEPPQNASQPDRILGLLCKAERVELAEIAKEIPEQGRDRLASMLKLEQASDTGMKLLTDAERAAARLHLDREEERTQLARLSEDANAAGERIEAMRTGLTVGPPALRNF